jgi:glycosyltransferase involved in cell wall biosynthesis
VNDSDGHLRILHLVSATVATQQSLMAQLTPVVTRFNKNFLNMEVVYFQPGANQSMGLRQLGVPVHEIEWSRRRFSLSALPTLLKLIRQFEPDVIHAWGHTAQVTLHFLKRFLKSMPPVVWTMPNTPAFAPKAGFLDRKKLELLKKALLAQPHVVYPTSAIAAQYRRLGFSDKNFSTIAVGVDVERYKADEKLRAKLRIDLKMDNKAFVIGMFAPFMPDNDYASFIKATAELIKYNPNVYVIIAGRGVQRGNSGLMGLLGGGTLASRTTLLGEWSDLSMFYNACDVACSSSLHDGNAMSLAVAMLCGVPCVGTGKGAQGEVLGVHGIAVEPGSPNGMIRGVTRIMEMPADRRAFVTKNARQHVLENYSIQGTVEKYMSLYMSLSQVYEASMARQAKAIGKLA